MVRAPRSSWSNARRSRLRGADRPRLRDRPSRERAAPHPVQHLDVVVGRGPANGVVRPDPRWAARALPVRARRLLGARDAAPRHRRPPALHAGDRASLPEGARRLRDLGLRARGAGLERVVRRAVAAARPDRADPGALDLGDERPRLRPPPRTLARGLRARRGGRAAGLWPCPDGGAGARSAEAPGTVSRAVGRRGMKELRAHAGFPIEPAYGPEDLAGVDFERDIGRPGEYPYTRGIHKHMYRERLWTMRQYVGFGTPAETNARFKYLMAHGQDALNVAFDLPTQLGLDSDDPKAEGEVGRVGMAVNTLADMEDAFAGIPLDRVSVSLTINGMAAPITAMYYAVAEKQGAASERIVTTPQNDILKEFIARGTWIYPVDPSLRLVADLIEFSARHHPRSNPLSVCGYPIREAGWTTAQEPETNIGRGAYTALAAALAGAQTMALPTYDEAYTIPSPKAQLIALRTMQICAEESGAADTVDPLAGSYYVEALTGAMEKRILEELAHVERMGGIVEAVKSGAIQAEVARQAYLFEQRMVSGEIPKVAVNCHVGDRPIEADRDVELYSFDPRATEAQVAKLARIRGDRDDGAVTAALGRLADEARGRANLMYPITEAVKAYATLGEIARAMRDVFGEHKETVKF